MGYYITYKNEYIVASIETAQDRYNFAEVKASITGEMLLEKQKEVLAIKTQWSEDLKDLLAMKNALAQEVEVA